MKTRKHNQDCKELQSMTGKDEGYTCICDSKPKKDKGIPCSNMREFDAVMAGETPRADDPSAGESASRTLTPTDHMLPLQQDKRHGGFINTPQGYLLVNCHAFIREDEDAIEFAAFIVRAVNSHEAMLKALVIAADDLHNSSDGDICSDKALCVYCATIAKAEGK